MKLIKNYANLLLLTESCQQDVSTLLPSKRQGYLKLAQFANGLTQYFGQENHQVALINMV